VSPGVANDTNATVAEARHLWEVIARPNLMIKVPGTGAASRGAVADRRGHQRQHHAAVRARDVRGGRGRVHRGAGGSRGPSPAARPEIDQIASVASFFVSRIDTSVDKLLTRR
jgi:transaldolase